MLCFGVMEFICVTLIIIIGITDSTADQFDVVGPVAPLLAVSGEDVILPCSLKPNISAVNMRVEWFRVDLKDSVVHLYEDHEDKNTKQLQSYRGRTEVFKDELQTGNTSLKLSRVQISDEGLYKCFIQSKTWYDDITVNLRVEVVGSPPLITVDGFDVSGGLHLQCETKGKMFNSWRSSVILISVGSVLIVISGILITVFVYRHREIQRVRLQTEDLRLQTEDLRLQTENQNLCEERERLSLIVENVKSLLRKYAVNVTLDPDSAHPHLIVSDDGKQVRYEEQSVKDGDQKSNNKFDEELCVLGNEGFTSGCFYYEVGVKGLSVWVVGVARESVERKGGILLNPESGFWMAGLRDGEYQASEGLSSVSLSLSVAPQRVGVFVDYEEGRVSFYDVESMCHIYTFTDQFFNETLYPVLSLSYVYFKNSSKAPLIICSDL
ncbi:butyrophilin subfamily 1 member A1-like isoform X3 [Paramisgurnus dabryanus]|uniref:butyrophilin subfamily 1 member A1-like isoform X3 n=1 Tax=Paramisgurnus dabryanus TaxID=90735 RepID=UPI003CCFA3C3